MVDKILNFLLKLAVACALLTIIVVASRPSPAERQSAAVNAFIEYKASMRGTDGQF